MSNNSFIGVLITPDSAPERLRQAYQSGMVLALLTGGLLSGSYLVDPETARDVDVFIPEYNWQGKCDPHIVAYELEGYDPLEGTSEYAQANEFGELSCLYRTDYGLNVIIVSANMWPAYLSAHRELAANPQEYTSKRKRANLFIRQKNIIHTMLGNQVRELQTED